MKYIKNTCPKRVEQVVFLLWAEETIDSEFPQFPKNKKITFSGWGFGSFYFVLRFDQYIFSINRNHKQIYFLYDSKKKIGSEKIFRCHFDQKHPNSKLIFQDAFRRFVKRILKTERIK